MGVANEMPSKHEVARKLLLKGTVFVHLDPRSRGVVVPPWLKRQPQLVLQVGLDMPLPIPDLRVDDAGVYGTLSFSRSAFSCSVPWDAVFALAGDDGRGMVWPGSMPEEIAAEVARESGRGRIRSVSADEFHERGTSDVEFTDGERGKLESRAFRARTTPPSISDRPRALMSDQPPALMSDQPPALLSDRPPALLSDRPSALLSDRPSASMSERPPALLSDRPSASMSERPPASGSTRPRTPAAGPVDRAAQPKRRVLPPYLRVVK